MIGSTDGDLDTGVDTLSGARKLKVIGFLIVGAFILLAPALPQLFGIQSPFLRPWIMYAGVGTGILKGEFLVTRPDKSTAVYASRDVLGVRLYPRSGIYEHRYQVGDADELRAVVAIFCEQLTVSDTLSFRGQVSAERGWKPLEGADLCRTR